MSRVLSIDPVTRVEGHLSVRVEVESGAVARAWCTGESFRGFESILVGRSPLDAQLITQRICGVCPVEHGVASVQAQDQAYGVTPPTNGRLIRNIVAAANFIQSHILHFYTLSAIDFIDVAAVLDYQGKDGGLNHLKTWIRTQLGSTAYYPVAPFLPRFEADYVTSLDINCGALHNYLKALEVRTDASMLGAMFGGKLPHVASLVPGGSTQRVDERQIQDALVIIRRIRNFIDTAYVPDVKTVAGAFPGYFKIGRGPQNFLSYGVFPENAANTSWFLSRGVLRQWNLQALDISRLTEDVRFSLFSSASGLHPSGGATTPSPDKAGAYSWIKAPRYDRAVMEVGPLARVLVTHVSNGNARLSAMVNGLLAELGRPVTDLASVMGRHAARAIECKLVADRVEEWLNALTPGQAGYVPFSIPGTGQGVGLTEAARGALGHWMQIGNSVVSRYQCVVPTTWNASPRDDADQPGAMEQALVGTPVANEAQPIEAVRVVRSFDPCLSCAVH
jgi:ferredoxin hydrogenase large subunit/hydrogenase large subunit